MNVYVKLITDMTQEGYCILLYKIILVNLLFLYNIYNLVKLASILFKSPLRALFFKYRSDSENCANTEKFSMTFDMLVTNNKNTQLTIVNVY